LQLVSSEWYCNVIIGEGAHRNIKAIQWVVKEKVNYDSLQVGRLFVHA